MTGKNNNSLRVLTNFLAFIVLIIVTILIVLTKINIINSSNILSILSKVAQILTYVILGLSSMWYVMSKRNVVSKIIWLACVVTIVVVVFI